MNRRCSLAMACLPLFAAPPAGAVGTAPAEPAAYRQDNYREPTPATVNGKPPTTTADAHRLWEARSALFLTCCRRHADRAVLLSAPSARRFHRSTCRGP